MVFALGQYSSLLIRAFTAHRFSHTRDMSESIRKLPALDTGDNGLSRLNREES
jgi:hypothetical protein